MLDISQWFSLFLWLAGDSKSATESLQIQGKHQKPVLKYKFLRKCKYCAAWILQNSLIFRAYRVSNCESCLLKLVCLMQAFLVALSDPNPFSWICRLRQSRLTFHIAFLPSALDSSWSLSRPEDKEWHICLWTEKGTKAKQTASWSVSAESLLPSAVLDH